MRVFLLLKNDTELHLGDPVLTVRKNSLGGKKEKLTVTAIETLVCSRGMLFLELKGVVGIPEYCFSHPNSL